MKGFFYLQRMEKHRVTYDHSRANKANDKGFQPCNIAKFKMETRRKNNIVIQQSNERKKKQQQPVLNAENSNGRTMHN